MSLEVNDKLAQQQAGRQSVEADAAALGSAAVIGKHMAHIAETVDSLARNAMTENARRDRDAQAKTKAAEMPPEICGALVTFKKAQVKIGTSAEAEARGGRKYKYATLGDVLEGVTPALAEAGLALFHESEAASVDGWGHGINITFVLVHESGKSHRFPSTFMACKSPDPHAIGSALTYGRRYSVLNCLGLAPTEDDDGRGAGGGSGGSFQQPGSARQMADRARYREDGSDRSQPPREQPPADPGVSVETAPYPWDKSLTIGQALEIRKKTADSALAIGHDAESLAVWLKESFRVESFLGDASGPENGGKPGLTKAQMEEALSDVLRRQRLLENHEAMGLPDDVAFHQWVADNSSGGFLHTLTAEQLKAAEAIAAEMVEDMAQADPATEEAAEEEGS